MSAPPRGPLPGDGSLWIAPALREACAAAGLRRVADVLAAARAVRDLPDRSNHELRVGGRRLFVKRTKPRRRWGLGPARAPNPPPEAAALARLAALGVPCAEVALCGVDARHGALTATYDLAPWRALDEVLAAPAAGGPGPVPGASRALLRPVVRAVARLHAAGLALRDLYANQVFVAPDGAGVALIDTERLRAHRGGLNRWVVKDLAGLAATLPPSTVPVRLRGLLLVEYIHLRNLPLRKALTWLAPRLRAKAERIRRHRPRTPVGAPARPGAAAG